MQINESIGAAGTLAFTEKADFIRVLAAGSPLTLRFYFNGAQVAEAVNVGAGYAEWFSEPFDKVVITSDLAQAVSIVTRLGNRVTYDQPPNGNVNGGFVNTQQTVTNASGQLLPANANRRYLLVQNKDLAADIYVRLDGGVASAATGVKIAAGGSYELQGYVPSGAVMAFGSVANNPNVVTVEG